MYLHDPVSDPWSDCGRCRSFESIFYDEKEEEGGLMM